jgi:hypothetical protein
MWGHVQGIAYQTCESGILTACNTVRLVNTDTGGVNLTLLGFKITVHPHISPSIHTTSAIFDRVHESDSIARYSTFARLEHDCLHISPVLFLNSSKSEKQRKIFPGIFLHCFSHAWHDAIAVSNQLSKVSTMLLLRLEPKSSSKTRENRKKGFKFRGFCFWNSIIVQFRVVVFSHRPVSAMYSRRKLICSDQTKQNRERCRAQTRRN